MSSLGTIGFHKHLVNRANQKKVKRRNSLAGLTLTSMVDMFSLLVIFLLQTFSTAPKLGSVAKGIVLPAAYSGKPLIDAPTLALTQADVYLDQKPIGTLEAILKDPSPLLTNLNLTREKWLAIHPGETFRGKISFQAHKDLPSTIVSQFMALLPSQNYSSVQMAVVAESKK